MLKVCLTFKATFIPFTFVLKIFANNTLCVLVTNVILVSLKNEPLAKLITQYSAAVGEVSCTRNYT